MQAASRICVSGGGEEGALPEWQGGAGESWETVGESCKNTKHMFLKIDALGDAATIYVVCICMQLSITATTSLCANPTTFVI